MKNRLNQIVVICLLAALSVASNLLCADEKAATKPLSSDAVDAAVKALKKEDVAWRRIDWKTCLLDGLETSREQHKPIVLWAFIDRPIDDERC